MSLTNPNTVVTEQRLNDFYKGILPYLGGMPEMVANKFSKGDLYSTEEKMIGRWKDGKPLYQKTLDLGTFPNATTKTVAHNISNIDTVANVTIVAKNDSGGFLVLPYIYNTNTLIYGITSTSILIIASQDRSGYIGYATIQYTKSTDSAISIGDANDYSTDEKIIGTWVDGKPLYQKTFVFDTALTLPFFDGTPSATAGNWVSTGISSAGIDKIVYSSTISSGGVLNPSFMTNKNATGATIGLNNIYPRQFEVKYLTIQYTKTTD